MIRLLDWAAKDSRAVLLFRIATLLFFLAFVFAPATYLVLSKFEFRLSDAMLGSLLTSFEIAAIATLIDIVFGVPAAWIVSRTKSPLAKFINSLADLPLIVPTSALGFSIALFWGGRGMGVLGEGFWMILLLHIAFTFPYVVRTVAAAIEETDINYEIAGRSLGASPLTSFRTISSPLFRGGLLIGAMLAFSRSLGETGATVVVAGLVSTAPVAIVGYKDAGDLASAVSLSVVLVLLSALLLVLVRVLSMRSRFSLGRIYPKLEFSLSRLSPLRDWATALFFLLIVIIPSFFFLKELSPSFDLSLVVPSIALSFAVALFATCANLVFGVPMGMLIGRSRRLGLVLDFLIDVVMAMPTVALGLSAGLFWGKADDFMLLALANISFTYPFIVKPVSAAVDGLDRNLEEASRSLGATPLKTFQTITLPLIFPSIFAGAVMAFMRSMSDTGAVLAVTKNLKTVPVLIVDLVKGGRLPEAAAASAVLLLVSFIALLMLRRKK